MASVPSRSFSAAGLFAGLDVVAHELAGAPDPRLLLAAERQAMANAAPGRQEQFAAGRACARAGLSVLGCPEEPLLVGEDRRPLWPSGVTGSISHTRGLGESGSNEASFGVAVVVLDAALGGRGIGVDVERVGRVREALFGRLFTGAELEDLRRLPLGESTKSTMTISRDQDRDQLTGLRSWLAPCIRKFFENHDGSFTRSNP